MYKLIAFDFDGTLADSVDFCLHVFELVFKKYMGENAPTRESIYQNFGMNEPGVLKFYMGDFNPAAENDFYVWHRELHGEKCPETYPGTRQLLEFLRERGVKTTLLTGRSETTCKISLEYLKLDSCFEFIQNGSPEKNDKAVQLQYLLKKYDLAPDELAYVGDAVSDAEACIRAGVSCLSAAWAKSARIAELEAINPGKVFTTVQAMQEFLAENIQPF
ncbi:MAG: HAD hydrolase-like protein [Lentisphaeria bacterium]|nr:HAD hydrolase-like protein [Lentisphaeria bacterium]